MTQVVKRGLAANAVDGTKLRLSNNESVRARNFANTSDLALLKANASDLAEFGVKPQSPFTPSAVNDLTTVGFVQDLVSGQINLKQAVVAASSANLALTGSSPLVVDGITLADGDRVGLVGQTDATENGIYDVDVTLGTYTLTRSADFDGSPSSEVKQGSTFDVINGSVNGKKRFLQTTSNPTVGVSNLVFVDVPAGAVVPVNTEEEITLDSTDITNQYVDLANEALDPSVKVYFSGILQRKGTDYTLSLEGGVTRVTFAGDLATAGAISLVNGDLLLVSYERE
jgi:hypothetical protein